MKLKNKRLKKSASVQLPWKAMPIECENGLNGEDFEGLVAIEELNGDQYAMQTGEGIGSIVVYSSQIKKIDDKLKNFDKDKKKNQEFIDGQTIKLKETKIKRKTSSIHENNNDQKKDKKIKISNGFVVTPIDNYKDGDELLEENLDESEEIEEINDENEEIEEINDENFNKSEWHSLSIPDKLISSLVKCGMKSPTEIQKETIPSAVQERSNIFGAAPTGSGKTLAFGIPLITNILQDRKENRNCKYLRALILTPTRELAAQIKKHIDNITIDTGIQTALIVGGLAIQKQERILEKFKPEIVVATPGRFWQILESSKIEYLTRDSIKKLNYIVIDEADKMIEKSRFDELKHIMEAINELVLKYDQVNEQEEQIRRQFFIFSATLTMIKNTDNFKKNNKKNNENQQNLMNLLRLKKENMKIYDLTEKGTKSTPSSDNLSEMIVHTMRDDKDAYLYYFLLSNPGRTIVFCNSIDCIRRLINIFRFLELEAIVIHSSMQQKRRLIAIEKFSKSQDCILLATDVASRGLDIPNVNHVLHYQVPRSAEIYIHRSGRTARINNRGLSLILCDPQEEAWFMRNISKVLNRNHIEEFQTNSFAMKKIKDRLLLAIKCDQMEHSLRKLRLTDDWFRASKKACEMEDSDDEAPNDPDENVALAEKNERSRKLKKIQNELKALLKVQIKFTSCSSSKVDSFVKN